MIMKITIGANHHFFRTLRKMKGRRGCRPLFLSLFLAELYLAVEDIEHSKTKAKSPQSNSICERFHKTVLNEFYRVAFRKKVYSTIEELQKDLDEWLFDYNKQRPHTGGNCYRKTPMQTFRNTPHLAIEKMLSNPVQTVV